MLKIVFVEVYVQVEDGARGPQDLVSDGIAHQLNIDFQTSIMWLF